MVLTCTIVTIVVMSFINMVIGHQLTMFPNQLSNHIGEFVTTEQITNELTGTSIIIFVLIFILLFAATFIFKRRELI